MSKLDEIWNDIVSTQDRENGRRIKSITMSESFFKSVRSEVEGQCNWESSCARGEPEKVFGIKIYRTSDLKEGFELNL